MGALKTYTKKVACEFYNNFPNIFLFVNKYWYHFNGVYWENDSDGRKGYSKTIRMLISTQLYNILHEQIDAAEYEEKMNMLNLLYDKKFKDNVVHELEQFYDGSGIEFNKRDDLLPFNNRIFDLTTCDWVEPTPDMYISVTTGYDYADVTDEEIESMERWVGELFDCEDTTRYVLLFLASCLSRKNSQQIANFWVGHGLNGKSCLKEMMNAVLGPFAGTINTNYFTVQENTLSGPNPHIYNLRHSRVIFCDNPERFSVERMTKLIGGDGIITRNMYDAKKVKFKAGSFVALTNEMPQFDYVTSSILNCIVCIVFPYQFMPPTLYNPADPTHRKQDPTIRENIFAKRNVFITMLLKWYPKLKYGLAHPHPRAKA
jgi:phage/plasmid-associated DNA primase